MQKWIGMGRLTKEPQTSYVGANNTACCKFTLAVNRRFKKEGQPSADFISVVAWGKTGEFANSYFKKGQQVSVIGVIQTRTWDDNEGKKQYATEIVAEEIYFADSKKEESGSQQAATTTPAQQSQPQPQAQDGNSGFYPCDDDMLPF